MRHKSAGSLLQEVQRLHLRPLSLGLESTLLHLSFQPIFIFHQIDLHKPCLLKHRVCLRQPSAEPEHECCVHNNIRCQLEAFLFVWREIIYKVYGKYTIKANETISSSIK